MADEALIARLLDRSKIDQAYPLVRSLVPGITLGRWNAFVRPQLAVHSAAWPHGVMTIQNHKGYILGLFSFEVRDDLYESRTLCIDNIVVPSMPGRELIWIAIADATDQLAKMNDCRAVRAGLNEELGSDADDRLWVGSSLQRSGYVLEGVRAFKRLDGEAIPAVPGKTGGGGSADGRNQRRA
ncbi:MAG: hypothetical protein IT563_15190 [Alphaproteobacteria bacterium]|nr:hypothetical protein [Alphaproteobacteria bacterium]